MAYRSFLHGEMFEIAYFTNTVVHWTAVRVGEADNPARTFSMMAYLSPMPGATSDTVEFAFCLMETDEASGSEYPRWDGRETRHIITDARDRKVCLGIVCSSLGTLLTEARPSHVFMQACNADLPPAALQKYERILETFRQLGYAAEEQEAYHGRKSWWMERSDA